VDQVLEDDVGEVTAGHGDLYKCAATVDGEGRAWIFWSENSNWRGKDLANFEVLARFYENGKLSQPIKVSDNAGNDVSPVATTDSSGRVWVAWQGARDNVFRILERHQDANAKWSAERVVSTQNGNCWTPAIATTAKGARVAIAWDNYDQLSLMTQLGAFSFPSAATAEARIA